MRTAQDFPNRRSSADDPLVDGSGRVLIGRTVWLMNDEGRSPPLFVRGQDFKVANYFNTRGNKAGTRASHAYLLESVDGRRLLVTRRGAFTVLSYSACWRSPACTPT